MLWLKFEQILFSSVNHNTKWFCLFLPAMLRVAVKDIFLKTTLVQSEKPQSHKKKKNTIRDGSSVPALVMLTFAVCLLLSLL